MARKRLDLSRIRCGFVFTLLLFVLSSGALIKRVPLLRGVAYLWLVSDPIGPSDVVVVLGGGVNVRPFVAADLYTKGLVRKILVSRVDQGRSVNIRANWGDTAITLTILRRLGVPDNAIECFGGGNKNTHDEAVALKSWTETHPASAIIIPVEPFFARRVKWIFQREFSMTGIVIQVPSFDPPSEYSVAEWWKTDAGVVTFQNEVLKYLYYRAIY
jgi:uncharacterized SAM-binding protein YcdF (DUF218 family)